ncbi:MAG: hypothetical protein VKL59_10060, partial [Nostocaceae cyanobacterium]|nr:hypothetical protein [Nostocaceae cyanobacterium]
PGEERRRSGSHYTPRSLTKPIVETTLRPVLEALGEKPTAEQILSLKVCGLAMGSGAFLVETCRQLAQMVVEAWEREENDTRLGISDRSARQRHSNQNATISNYGKEEPLLPLFCHSRQRKKRKSLTKGIKIDDCVRYS